MGNLAISLAILICLPFYFIACTFIEESIFARHEGSYLSSESFENFTTRTHTSCLIECQNLNRCRHVNILRSSTENYFLCQIFNCLIGLENNLLVSEDYTYYKVHQHEKGTDCQAWHNLGFLSSSIFTLTSWEECRETTVYCDMATDGRGWILLQRRFNGSVDFYRTWDEYKNGFGSLEGEFWLGLENFHQLAKKGNITLRFELWDGPDHGYMDYYDATIADEADKYRLDWQGGSEGAAGDALVGNKGCMFSTKDSDNDRVDFHCAQSFRGGWWFSGCSRSHLNGLYGDNRNHKGIAWQYFKGIGISLQKSEIKFKSLI